LCKISVKDSKWLSVNDIIALDSLPDEIILISHLTVDVGLSVLSDLVMYDNVFVTRTGGIPGLLQGRRHSLWPINRDTTTVWGNSFIRHNLGGVLVGAIANNWGITVDELVH